MTDQQPDLTTLFARATAAAANAVTPKVFGGEEHGTAHYVVPSGWQVQAVDLEEYAATPARKRGCVTLTRTESLVQYLSEQADPGMTTVFANGARIEAILDDHTPEAPGWRQHRAVLALQPTIAWKRWNGTNGQLLEQEQFIDHLEAGMAEIADPPGADLYELASTLQATSKAEFRSARAAGGDVTVQYTEEQTARAGGNGSMTLPSKFTLVLTVYEGSDPVTVKARLRWRIVEGKLRLGYIIDAAEDIMRAASEAEALKVRDAGYTVLWGMA